MVVHGSLEGRWSTEIERNRVEKRRNKKRVRETVTFGVAQQKGTSCAVL